MYNSSTLKHRLAVNRSFEDLKHRRGIATTPLSPKEVQYIGLAPFSLSKSNIDTTVLYLYNSKRGSHLSGDLLDLRATGILLQPHLFQFTISIIYL